MRHTYTHSHSKKGSKRTYLRLKKGHILLIIVLLKFNFEHKGHLYASFLLCIFSFCLKCLLFQFLSRGICMHIPILTGVQIGHTNHWKDSHILLKKWYFWSLFSEMKVTCIPIVCFIFLLFTVNAFFLFLRFWHTYAHSLPNPG